MLTSHLRVWPRGGIRRTIQIIWNVSPLSGARLLLIFWYPVGDLSLVPPRSTGPLSRKLHPYCLSIVYSSQRESLTALTPPSNLRPNTAVMGSNLGTNVALVGAITSPSSDLCGTLLTATYANNNASTMVWIDVATTFFSAIQCHLETWTPENSGNWLNHSWRFFFKSLGNSLSQPDHSKLVSSFYSFILHVYLY